MSLAFGIYCSERISIMLLLATAPSHQTSDDTSEPSSKKRRTALFGHYRAASQNPNDYDEPSNQLSRYIILINSDSFDSTAESSALSKLYSDFALLQPLFQRLFCVPASSAPVERVFSQSGLIMSSHCNDTHRCSHLT